MYNSRIAYVLTLAFSLVLLGKGMPLGHSFELPEGKTAADLKLGPRPTGPAERAVRIVPWAELPGQVQQATARGHFLYFAVLEGQVWRFDLRGNRDPDPFLDIAAARAEFRRRAPSGGLRGLAFHPDFEANGLFYTMHEENNGSGREPDYGIAEQHLYEFVLAEWNFNELGSGQPSFREVFRVSFAERHHNAQQIGFNPIAEKGGTDYGNLYLCFADNGNAPNSEELHDPFKVGQDFQSIHASIIRIHPMDPSGLTDSELNLRGLRRSENGRFSIPLSNPFIDDAGKRDELFAKGFRNPLSMSFSPTGSPVVGDIGQQSFEEINLVESGGNYGWSAREGYFITAYASQADGSFLGADASQRWVPYGDASDPAESFFLRDSDGSNLRIEQVARTGEFADGITYPVTHFGRDGNHWDDRIAVVAGDYYTGIWAEELRGLYLFGNFSWDQIFYIGLTELRNDQTPAETYLLPIVDEFGDASRLSNLIGEPRGNFRFAKDGNGDIYIASKTNKMIYRLQGTPRSTVSEVFPETSGLVKVSLNRPGPDASYSYVLERSTDGLAFEAVPLDEHEIHSLTVNDDGTETVVVTLSGRHVAGETLFLRFRSVRAQQ